MFMTGMIVRVDIAFVILSKVSGDVDFAHKYVVVFIRSRNDFLTVDLMVPRKHM